MPDPARDANLETFPRLPEPLVPTPAPRGAISTTRQAGIVATAIATIAAVATLSHEVSFVQVDGRVLGWSATAMFLLTLLKLFALRQARLLPRTDEEWIKRSQTRPRKRKGNLDVHDRRFKHGRLGQLFLPLAVLSIALPTTKATTLLLAIAFVLSWLWAKKVESELVDLQADMHARNAATRAEAREAASLQRAANNHHPHAPVVSPCIDPHIAAARRAAVQRTRRALISVTALASTITILAAWSATVSAITLVSCVTNGRCHQPPRKPKKEIAPRPGSKSSTRQPSPPATAPAASTGAQAPALETPCPPITDTAGAPTGKVRELEALYSDVGSLGRAVAGCPAAVIPQRTPEGTLYWARGESGSPTKSVAVVPPGYKNTIVIGPAVAGTEELLLEGRDVHGPETFPRYEAGPGVLPALPRRR